MKKKMEVKVANKFFKHKYILCFVIFTFCIQIGYAQKSKDEIYFILDKSDTLIKKQFNSATKKISGYLIIDERRVKPLNRTPMIKGKVWVPESDDDFYTFGPSFSFIRKNDRIITEDELTQLNVIKSRKEFLHKFSSIFNNSETSYFFIEPINCSSNYILRKVSPVIFE
jgi:hypothetical protein